MSQPKSEGGEEGEPTGLDIAYPVLLDQNRHRGSRGARGEAGAPLVPSGGERVTEPGAVFLMRGRPGSMRPVAHHVGADRPQSIGRADSIADGLWGGISIDPGGRRSAAGGSVVGCCNSIVESLFSLAPPARHLPSRPTTALTAPHTLTQTHIDNPSNERMLARQVLKRGAPAVARRQAGLVSVCVREKRGVGRWGVDLGFGPAHVAGPARPCTVCSCSDRLACVCAGCLVVAAARAG